MICGKCGKRVDNNSTRCEFCGVKFAPRPTAAESVNSIKSESKPSAENVKPQGNVAENEKVVQNVEPNSDEIIVENNISKQEDERNDSIDALAEKETEQIAEQAEKDVTGENLNANEPVKKGKLPLDKIKLFLGAGCVALTALSLFAFLLSLATAAIPLIKVGASAIEGYVNPSLIGMLAALLFGLLACGCGVGKILFTIKSIKGQKGVMTENLIPAFLPVFVAFLALVLAFVGVIL